MNYWSNSTKYNLKSIRWNLFNLVGLLGLSDTYPCNQGNQTNWLPVSRTSWSIFASEYEKNTLKLHLQSEVMMNSQMDPYFTEKVSLYFSRSATISLFEVLPYNSLITVLNICTKQLSITIMYFTHTCSFNLKNSVSMNIISNLKAEL